MGVLKWYADADTTITNAYKEGLVQRGSTANMGIADALEVFLLHGQAAKTGTASKEMARILIRFNVETLRDSLVAGDVPTPDATNAPKYILRLFNAPHPEVLARNFELSVHNLGSAFEEGAGLDMSEYADVGAASWTNATKTASVVGTGTITVQSNPTSSFTVVVDSESYTVAAGGSANATRDLIVTALGGSSIVNVANSGSTALIITAKTAGLVGNYRYYVTSDNGTFVTADYYMTDGSDYTAWGTAMGINTGDYTGTGTTAGNLTGTYPSAVAVTSQTFTTGEEDMLLDITNHVENIIWTDYATPANGTLRTLVAMQALHNGFLIKVVDENLGSSVYTKKFFARSSEYFFKRPHLEARWDSSTKDRRAEFFAEHTLLTNAQNTQDILLYNSVGGARANYTFPAGEELYVRFYTDPDYTQAASLKDPNDGYASAIGVAATNPLTGVYQASTVINTTGSIVYDKWYSATTVEADSSTWTVVHTGSFAVSQRTLSASAKKEKYIFSITNLKNSYTRTEKPRFRLYSRLKDWSPTIYTMARKSLENKIVDNIYFKLFRVVDDEEVVGYGRGTTSTNNDHTLLSYDGEGSYFDFDMSLLEAGYMYGIRFLTSIDGELREQKEVFKFRVD